MASLIEITGNLGTDRAAHLLRRATFGPTIAQINQFAAYTATEAMNALFTEPAQNPAPPIDPQTAATWVDPSRHDEGRFAATATGRPTAGIR